MLNRTTMSFGEERNTERPNTYWIFDHGNKTWPMKRLLSLKVRPPSLL